MVDDFAALGCAAALGKWRAYLYDDGDDAPCVGHLNGSRAQPLADLDAQHAANPGRTGTVGRRWKPTDTTGAAGHEAAGQELCAPGRVHETTGERLPAWVRFACLAAFVVAFGRFLCVLGRSGLDFGRVWAAPGMVLEVPKGYFSRILRANWAALHGRSDPYKTLAGATKTNVFYLLRAFRASPKTMQN